MFHLSSMDACQIDLDRTCLTIQFKNWSAVSTMVCLCKMHNALMSLKFVMNGMDSIPQSYWPAAYAAHSPPSLICVACHFRFKPVFLFLLRHGLLSFQFLLCVGFPVRMREYDLNFWKDHKPWERTKNNPIQNFGVRKTSELCRAHEWFVFMANQKPATFYKSAQERSHRHIEQINTKKKHTNKFMSK